MNKQLAAFARAKIAVMKQKKIPILDLARLRAASAASS